MFTPDPLRCAARSMRVPDRFAPMARALLLAGLYAFGLAGIVASGSDDARDPNDDRQSDGVIALSETSLVVARGENVLLRVDVNGLQNGEGVSGYSISLSEETTNIDITTTACPTGVGTESCQHWTIAPGVRSVPGRYDVEIRAVGTSSLVFPASMSIEVTDAPAQGAAVAVATQRLVLTTDGRLWATGDNRDGQSGVGILSVCGADSHPCLQPADIHGYVAVGSDTNWIDVIGSASASLAVRGDGSLWVWGDNGKSALGFPSADQAVIAPRQMEGLTNVRQVSMGTRSFLALRDNGTVYAWGLPLTERCHDRLACDQTVTLEPQLVPITVDGDGNERILTNVVQVAGGSSNRGDGFALALRQDGSVLQWGTGRFVAATSFDLGPVWRPAWMPVQVTGLPGGIQAIAAGSAHNGSSYALALDADGNVWTWTRLQSVATLVAGLYRIVAVDAQQRGPATALRDDGTVWLWMPGDSTPQLVAGLPTIARLGRNAAGNHIAADCADGGSLWQFSTTSRGEAEALAPTRRPEFGTRAQEDCPAPAMARLSVSYTGEGTILTQPVYLNCGTTCEALVPLGSRLAIRTRPAPGWKDNRSEASTCGENVVFVMTADKSCTHAFERVPDNFTLSVSLPSNGRVTSNPEGIDCPGDCSQNYSGIAASSGVTLSGIADPGYRFSEFRGSEDCADGALTVDSSRHCEAVFVPLPAPAAPSGLSATAQVDSIVLAWTPVNDNSVVNYSLERSQDGVAFAFLNSFNGATTTYRDTDVAPATIYTYRLIAINASGSSAPATVTAMLQPSSAFTLTVQVTGQGSVSSSPAGISCGADCSESYSLVTNVTLTATAAANSQFESWGGDCAGTAPTAMVTVDRNTACSARFTDETQGGWQTLASAIDTSTVRDLRSSVALDQSGLAYIAYLQTFGTQTRLTVRKEGPGFPLLTTFNSNDTWSATGAQLAIDPAGDPVIVFNVELEQIWAARWNGSTFDLLRDGAGNARLNLTGNNASRPRMVRTGNTLVLAWMEANQIALRRYNLDTRQFDAGAFVPGPTNPFDIDLALDSNGLAVIAWSGFTLLGERLQAIRETGPGTWTALGGDIGVRPLLAPRVVEFGIHIDTNDAIRIVWLEGDTFYQLSLAQFDGAAWTPLPGRPETLYFISGLPVRSLSVNRNPALFAFAYEWDFQSVIDGAVAVRQLVGGQLTMVGGLESTAHPRVGHLSLAMNEADRATLAQSQFTAADMTYRLVIRRHVP